MVRDRALARPTMAMARKDGPRGRATAAMENKPRLAETPRAPVRTPSRGPKAGSRGPAPCLGDSRAFRDRALRGRETPVARVAAHREMAKLRTAVKAERRLAPILRGQASSREPQTVHPLKAHPVQEQTVSLPMKTARGKAARGKIGPRLASPILPVAQPPPRIRRQAVRGALRLERGSLRPTNLWRTRCHLGAEESRVVMRAWVRMVLPPAGKKPMPERKDFPTAPQTDTAVDRRRGAARPGRRRLSPRLKSYPMPPVP